MAHVLRCSGYDLAKADLVCAEGPRLLDTSGNSCVDFEAVSGAPRLGTTRLASRGDGSGSRALQTLRRLDAPIPTVAAGLRARQRGLF